MNIKDVKNANRLSREELKALLQSEPLQKDETCSRSALHAAAYRATSEVFGDAVYIRGLIEFSNYCRNDCLYCGLRRSNSSVRRYRMTAEQILDRCAYGHSLGFRTFVLQSGEDSFFTDDVMCDLIRRIKSAHPDCAVTLSIGERSRECLAALREAGADRYLLRQETANAALYASLHPPELRFESRRQCLFDLKELGYQVGCGFMVGLPGQTLSHIAEDLQFIKELDPAMVGVGPFIPHSATPLAGESAGSVELTLNCLAILRLMKATLLLPATTALGTIDAAGQEKGVLAGANVVMPNITPPQYREKYLLYDNKVAIKTDDIKARMSAIGREIVVTRGDYAEHH
jgi:biotin synthase